MQTYVSPRRLSIYTLLSVVSYCRTLRSAIYSYRTSVALSQIQAGETGPMKTNHNLAMTLFAGVSIGLAVAQVIHAQQAKVVPAFIIAEVEKDPTKPQDPVASRK